MGQHVFMWCLSPVSLLFRRSKADIFWSWPNSVGMEPKQQHVIIVMYTVLYCIVCSSPDILDWAIDIHINFDMLPICGGIVPGCLCVRSNHQHHINNNQPDSFVWINRRLLIFCKLATSDGIVPDTNTINKANSQIWLSYQIYRQKWAQRESDSWEDRSQLVLSLFARDSVRITLNKTNHMYPILRMQ